MRLTTLLATTLLLAVGLLPAQDIQLPSAEEDALIKAAMPSYLRATPAAPRTVLVYVNSPGFYHSSIPYGAQAMAYMGHATGAFEPVVSDDPAVFLAESLAGFDGVVFMNTTGDLFMPRGFQDLGAEEQEALREEESAAKESFRAWVEAGGAVIGVHGATDAYYGWPWWGQMFGGYFDMHPWHERVTLHVEEPRHILNHAFFGRDFSVVDEIYQFRAYNRENVRVLTSLHTGQTSMERDNMKREDHDFAVSWIKRQGEGRVFYLSLGHRHEIFWNPVVLRHLLDGTQWALGDLPADDRPSATLVDGDGFRPLFNGSDLKGWMGARDQWTADRGELAPRGGAPLLTAGTFDAGTLRVAFRLADQSAGALHLVPVAEDADPVVFELADSAHHDTPATGTAGAVRGGPVPAEVAVHAPGDGNVLLVEVTDGAVSVTLNGTVVVPAEAGVSVQSPFRLGVESAGPPVWFQAVGYRPPAG